MYLPPFILNLFIPANLPVLVAGICMGWTSSMFPLLSADGVGNPLESIPSTETLSWIGSSLAIGAIIAPFAGGYLADRIGRKKTLLGTSPLFIISFLLLALHPTLEWIFVARFLQVSLNELTKQMTNIGNPLNRVWVSEFQ